MTADQLIQWLDDRARQQKQHPGPTVMSRGDHYRRKNTGTALRTFRIIKETT